jgi:hypothetical protein
MKRTIRYIYFVTSSHPTIFDLQLLTALDRLSIAVESIIKPGEAWLHRIKQTEWKKFPKMTSQNGLKEVWIELEPERWTYLLEDTFGVQYPISGWKARVPRTTIS